MSQDRRPRRALRIAVMAGVAAIAVAACGDAAVSVAPAATITPVSARSFAPTPTALPSPSAADVSAAFFTKITDPAFSAKEAFSGTLKVGTNEGTMTGSGIMSGRDSNETLTVTTSATTIVASSISIGAKDWNKTEPGPWLVTPKEAKPAKSFSDYLAALAGFVDLGVGTRQGRQLHHLQPKGGNAIPKELVGFANQAVTKDEAFTVDFYATDDGTPVSVVRAGTWTIVNGDVATPASVTFEDTLTEVGRPHAIVPPDDVWIRYHATGLGYSMAHPAGWTVKRDKNTDSYLLDGQGYVYVAATPFKGTTDAYATALRASYLKPFHGDPAAEKKTALGGQAGVRMIYQFTNDTGQDVTVVDDVTTRKGTGWEVFLITTGGTDGIDAFDEFSASFEFDP